MFTAILMLVVFCFIVSLAFESFWCLVKWSDTVTWRSVLINTVISFVFVILGMIVGIWT